jgi:hypothetical protein
MAKKRAAQKNAGNGKITQADAVRQALASGVVSSKAGMEFIKKKFGMTMKPQAYYSYKSQLLRRNGKGKPLARKLAPAPAKARGTNDLGDLRTVKGLVDKYGAQHVKEIVELFQ